MKVIEIRINCRETDLFDNFSRRPYNPNTGRFMTKDPIGFAGGDLNLYRYVGNNPVNRVDPEGKNAIAITIGAIAIGIVVHDIYNYIRGEPSVTGRISDYLRGQLPPSLRDFLNIPNPNSDYGQNGKAPDLAPERQPANITDPLSNQGPTCHEGK